MTAITWSRVVPAFTVRMTITPVIGGVGGWDCAGAWDWDGASDEPVMEGLLVKVRRWPGSRRRRGRRGGSVSRFALLRSRAGSLVSRWIWGRFRRSTIGDNVDRP